jgi:hypothetical protein
VNQLSYYVVQKRENMCGNIQNWCKLCDNKFEFKKKKCFNNKVHGKYGMVHIIQQGCKDNQGCIMLISQKN